MRRTTLAAALAFATLAAFATPAQAGGQIGIQAGPNRGYYDRGRYEVRRIAFDNGYRDGLREGEKDDRSDDRYNYRDERRYRQGDAGYRREYGSRFAYASAYRQGFEDGYHRAYSNRRTGRFDRRRY